MMHATAMASEEEHDPFTWKGYPFEMMAWRGVAWHGVM